MTDYKKILIIGGGGFIGRHLINDLLKHGLSLHVLDRVHPTWLPPDVEFTEGDFTAEHILEDVLSNCDAVYHLASTTLPQISNSDPVFDISSNLVGTVKLLELAVKHNIKKFIYPSSGGTVYGIPKTLPVSEDHPTDPTCSYGIVKLAIEKYLKLFHELHDLNYCCLRISNPYGEYQRVDRSQGAIAVFLASAITDEPIHIWGDGSVSRDFMYIKDVSSALKQALLVPQSNCTLNIGSGTATSLNEILDEIQKLVPHKLKIIYSEGRPFDVPTTCLDIKRAKSVLNWEPTTSLFEGLSNTYTYLQAASS